MTPTIIGWVPQHLERIFGIQLINQFAGGVIGIHNGPIARFHDQDHARLTRKIHGGGYHGGRRIPRPLGNIPLFGAIMPPQNLFLFLSHDPHQWRPHHMSHINHTF